MKFETQYFPVALAAVIAMLGSVLNSSGAENSRSTSGKEHDLIGILQSDAPPQDKAITCKKLAIYGSKEAVPALAPLLKDAQLASWARIALEAIPDPAADEALRAAVPSLQGRLLIGVVNSIGVRRDAKAVSALAEKLNDTDSEVASAAAEALGHIGDGAAIKALEEALTSARGPVRSSVAYGCILAAERLMAEGKSPEAASFYDKVRQASVPKQRVLEATRGAILARGSAGIPMLLQQLRSDDIALVGIGLRTARELPGRDVTEALAHELDQSNTDRQVPLLLALSDRSDSSVLPKLLQVAGNSAAGAKPARVAALGLLDRFRDLSSVPVLLNAAAENDAQLAGPAKTTLTRLGGKDIDADLLARLRLSSGKTRQVLIDLAKLRRMPEAMPVVLRSSEDQDPGVRRAAVEAIGVLGTDQDTSYLAHMLPTAQKLEEREDIETALLAICGRNGARCLPQVLPLIRSGDSAVRVVGLHALASVGGAEALDALRGAMNDSEESVRDEAVRTLSNWPSTWPEDSGAAEPLLALAKSGQKASYKVQGLQGYLQYVQETKKLSNEEKLGKVNDLSPLVKSPEEQRLVISVLGAIPTAGSLEKLMALAGDTAVTEEACQAILRIATDKNQKDASVDVRRKALQTVADKSENDATKKKASDALKRIR